MVSIVIVSYNVSQILSECLNSLESFKNKYSVWVVDNASVDFTAKNIKDKYPWVKLLENKKNLGFAKANNQALKQIKSKYVFLLNPDAEVVDDAIDKMIGFMERNNDVGILGPKLINEDGSLQKERSSFPGLFDQILLLLKLHRTPKLNKFVYPDYDYEKNSEAEHLMGSALMVRKKVFDEIGYFDEDFFVWFEEVDLEKRAKEAGWKIVYYSEAQVKHLVGRSTRQLNPFIRQTIWNKSLWHYFSKHRPFLERIGLVPFMLLSYFLSTFVFLRRVFLLR